MAIVAFGAVGWLCVTPDHIWPGYVLVLLPLLTWPGMELSNFNILLDMAGGQRDRHRVWAPHTLP